MNRKWLPLATLLFVFALLTLAYFRYSIFVGPEAFMTRHLATDLYEPFMNVHNFTEWLGQGFIPIGDYWMNRGGGFPAVPLEQLAAPFNLLLTAVYTITGSFPVSLRILMPLFYFLTLITAYWYGTIILKRRDASIVMSVAYTFSMYGVVQLEHICLVSVQPLVLLTLIFLEKVLSSPERLKYVILTSVFLFLTYLTQLYPFYFTVVFIAFRGAFHMLTSQQRLDAVKSTAKVGVIFLLLVVPFLLSQLSNIPSQQVQYVLSKNLVDLSQPPDLLFLRSTADVPIPEVSGPFYLGLTIIVLLLIPVVLRKTNRIYVFYLLFFLFSIVYALGSYSPLNIAGWVQEHVPLSFFLRAVIRIMVIGYLCLAVCAAIGFVLLADKLRSHTSRLLLLSVVVVVIFCDLTIGYEPTTFSRMPAQNNAYEFLRRQEGEFRIVEIPSTYLQMATSSVYTNHDVLSSYAWAHGYFDPLYAFTDVHKKYLRQKVTAQEAAFYGVKYVIVNTDPQYYNDLYLALRHYGNPKLRQVHKIATYLSTVEDYEPVYNEGGYAIYENLLYRGIVFSDEATIQYRRIDPNTLMIDYNSKKPTAVTISQSYSDGWIATLDGTERLLIRELDSIQQIDVPAGSHNVLLHYQNYERWFIILAVCYTVLTAVIVWLVIKRRRFEKCLKD